MRITVALLALVWSSWACGRPTPTPVAEQEWSRVPVSIAVHLAQNQPSSGFVPTMVYDTGDTVYLSPRAELASEHIVRAEAVDQPVGLALNLWLTDAGREQHHQIMTRHVGEYVAVLIDGVLVAPPSVVVGSPDGAAGANPPASDIPLTIAVPLPRDQAQRLASAVAQTWPAPGDH
jgi:preprotein translocase subunit SecD